MITRACCARALGLLLPQSLPVLSRPLPLPVCVRLCVLTHKPPRAYTLSPLAAPPAPAQPAGRYPPLEADPGLLTLSFHCRPRGLCLARGHTPRPCCGAIQTWTFCPQPAVSRGVREASNFPDSCSSRQTPRPPFLPETGKASSA